MVAPKRSKPKNTRLSATKTFQLNVETSYDNLRIQKQLQKATSPGWWALLPQPYLLNMAASSSRLRLVWTRPISPLEISHPVQVVMS